MKIRISRRHLRLSILMTVCALYIVSYLQSASQRQQRQGELGRFTARQALKRSQSVYLSLMQRPEPVLMSAEPESYGRKGLPAQRSWYINCEERAHLRWDADTGMLLSATFDQPLSYTRFPSSLMGRAEALHYAQHILDLLAPVLGSGWRIEPEAQSMRYTWVVIAQKDRLHLRISLDVVNGAVHCLSVF